MSASKKKEYLVSLNAYASAADLSRMSITYKCTNVEVVGEAVVFSNGFQVVGVVPLSNILYMEQKSNKEKE